jgi:hypothetical protein
VQFTPQVKVFKCSLWLSNFLFLVVALWFLCTTGTTLHLILPHIVSNELHNSMWPAVRKCVVWKMLFTIKGCTFQFPLNLFTYIYMSIPPHPFPPHTRKWQYPLSRQGFQQLILIYCFLKTSFQALQWPRMNTLLFHSLSLFYFVPACPWSWLNCLNSVLMPLFIFLFGPSCITKPLESSFS